MKLRFDWNIYIIVIITNKHKFMASLSIKAVSYIKILNTKINVT